MHIVICNMIIVKFIVQWNERGLASILAAYVERHMAICETEIYLQDSFRQFIVRRSEQCLFNICVAGMGVLQGRSTAHAAPA